MKEFIEKLIERLEEESFDMSLENPDCKAVWTDKAIEIVNQLAEEYIPCTKSSCSECEVYDKEKHYCPKWCEVIKHTTNELAEEHNNDFCEWRKDKIMSGMYVACSGYVTYLKDFKFCPYCGKKIKIAPYQPKGE